jgi:hypothetical protein
LLLLLRLDLAITAATAEVGFAAFSANLGVAIGSISDCCCCF